MNSKVNPSLHGFLDSAGVEAIPSSLPNFPMLFKPRKYQVHGLNLSLRYNRFGLFDDAGVGKSAVMQAYMLLHVAWGNKVVCLMPPILLKQFIQETHEVFLGSEDWLSHTVLNGSPAAREKLFKTWNANTTWPGVLLMTYEMFSKVHPTMKESGYNVLITDEAQKLRGSTSKVHAVVHNYTEVEADTTLLLATGTPIHHTPLDAYAMTRLINRGVYKSLEGFKRLHCNITSFRISRRIRGRMRRVTVETIEGYKNLDTLHARLYANARRIEKDKALNLEEPTIIPIDLEMAPAHKKLYNLLVDEKLLEVGDERVITATQASEMRQHLMHLACDPSEYSDKPIKNNVFLQVETLLDSIGGSNKVLLYAHHNRVIQALSELLKERNPKTVYGRNTSVQNNKAVVAFKEDPECKILISHPQSGGVGLNLQKVCQYLIFVEPTSIQGDFKQTLARVHRQGQKNAVVVYILRIVGTVYPKMVEVMLDNSDLAREVNKDAASFRSFLSGS